MAYLEMSLDNLNIVSACDRVVSAETHPARPEICFDYIYKYAAATSFGTHLSSQFLTVPTCDITLRNVRTR
jgi:hypothetical protein